MIGIRSFWDALPTEGRWLLSTVAVQTLGRGLTLPFTVIYLHEVRGFDLGLSGALMSLIAISGLVVTGPGGSLTDRYGARAVLRAHDPDVRGVPVDDPAVIDSLNTPEDYQRLVRSVNRDIY